MIRTLQIRDSGAASLEPAVRALRADGVVCFPTDTTYGLAVDPSSGRALDRLFELKGRDEGKPILLLVDSIAMVHSVALPNALFERVARAFWPGPITLIAPARGHLPDRLTAGTGTVGLRWPDAALPLRLIAGFGGPITATSANRSRQPVVTSAEAVLAELGDGIDVLIDGGERKEMPPSTLLDVTGDTAVMLREGPVSPETLERVLGRVARRLA